MTREEWQDFSNACFRKRVSAEKFRNLVIAFDIKHGTLPGRTLVNVVLTAGQRALEVDPRSPSYIRELLDMKRITIADTLSALSEPAAFGTNGNDSDQTALDGFESHKSLMEVMLLQMMTTEVSDGLIKTKEEFQAVVNTMTIWTSNIPNASALGVFVSALLDTTLARDVLTHKYSKGLKRSLGRLLNLLITQNTQTNIQLASTLDYWQKQYSLHEDASSQSLDLLHGVDLGALSFQESILDNRPITTRSGLFVYLSALLHARPLFDDLAVNDFLNARYKGDYTSLVTDLILASFDVLANAMYRSEPSESISLLRSFLVNKLPVFLNNYAGLIFPPLTIQDCISSALLRVDPAAFPSFSQMFDLMARTSVLSEARQEFLFACALHQLIPEQSIEILLGDVPMQSLPASGRYSKDDLVAQCTTSPGKIEELIGEMENMEGNAGEIAGALIEIMHTLCANNDTMTLKGICNVLSSKPVALDVIMLFTRPSVLLQPLSHALDSWQDHEDQGEYQPVYDEFGSILLLIIIVRHRFDLQDCDLAIEGSNSFVRKYFKNACVSRSPSELSEHENQLLSGWIRGLFETEGISDELMAMCSPKEFHLLIATLFDQSLRACQAKALALETLTGGFEYLLEPFLLPSLVAGLIWFTHSIWETNETSPNTNIIFPALETLLKPPSMSRDSSAMHSAVLSIVAKSLEESLNHAQRQHPLRVDINRLLETLKPHAHKARHAATAYSELETWASTTGGGLLAACRQTIQSLVLWSSATSTDTSPPHYTHRQLLETVMILGAKTVLQLLIDEVMTHLETGSPSDVDVVLDIIVVMISAPQQDSPLLHSPPLTITPATLPSKRQLTLPEALDTEHTSAFELSKTNLPRASMIVRLHRRVDALVGQAENQVSNAVGGDGGGLDGSALGLTAVVHNADGMPTADIDDVLVEAGDQIAAQDFLGGAGGAFDLGMGVGEGL